MASAKKTPKRKEHKCNSSLELVAEANASKFDRFAMRTTSAAHDSLPWKEKIDSASQRDQANQNSCGEFDLPRDRFVVLSAFCFPCPPAFRAHNVPIRQKIIHLSFLALISVHPVGRRSCRRSRICRRRSHCRNVSQPFQRMTPDDSVAFRYVCPANVCSQAQEDSRRALVAAPCQHDLVALAECSAVLFGMSFIHLSCSPGSAPINWLHRRQ